MIKTIKEVLQTIAAAEMPPNEQVMREAVLRLKTMLLHISEARVPGPCSRDEQHKIKVRDLYLRDERGNFFGNRCCLQCGAALLLELGAGDLPPWQYAGLDEAGNLVEAENGTMKTTIFFHPIRKGFEK